MDDLAGLLDGPRARGAFALRTVMRSPWSLRILAESPVTLIAAITGELSIVPDAGDPVRLVPGDIAVTRAPDHYNVADTPTTLPTVIVHPGQRCCDLDGASVTAKVVRQVKGDKIYIADFILTLEPANDEGAKASYAPKVSEPPPLPPSQPVQMSSIPVRRPATRRPLASESRAPASADIRGTSLPPRSRSTLGATGNS